MVRPMVRQFRAAALLALLLLAQACGRKGDAEPQAAAQGLLAAVASGDAKGFEDHTDREAVRADLRRQIAGLAQQSGLEVDGGPSDAALDRMIGPDLLHLVAAGTEAPLAAPPSPAQVALMSKRIDRDHVCVHDLTPAQACILTFARQPNGWRLVAMPAADRKIEVPAEPPKKG